MLQLLTRRGSGGPERLPQVVTVQPLRWVNAGFRVPSLRVSWALCGKPVWMPRSRVDRARQGVWKAGRAAPPLLRLRRSRPGASTPRGSAEGTQSSQVHGATPALGRTHVRRHAPRTRGEDVSRVPLHLFAARRWWREPLCNRRHTAPRGGRGRLSLHEDEDRIALSVRAYVVIEPARVPLPIGGRWPMPLVRSPQIGCWVPMRTTPRGTPRKEDEAVLQRQSGVME